MKISIFGLGYVGVVSCACFAKAGHEVIGVDISQHKVDLINSGKSPIIEKDLEEYIGQGVNDNLIRATTDVVDAVMNTDVSIICVGTPSQMNGNIDLTYIYQVCYQIGEVLKGKDSFHTLLIRSTVIPGTVAECTSIIEETSGKKHDVDFGFGSNPEFLREGTAVHDFQHPPYTIAGTTSEKVADSIREMYATVEGAVYILKPEESEMIKYANNNFHAMKITFANEIGNICKELGVDGHVVMDIVSKDKKLNLSSYYLKPGFAYGGSCLPKDVRGLNYRARALDLKTPLLNSLNESNAYQIDRGLKLVYDTGKTKIGFLGFAFKADTDDMRESPIITMIETLIGKGFDLALYDSNVLMSKLLGKNKDFVIGRIPHIAKVLRESIKEVIEHSDAIIIGNGSKEFKEAVKGLSDDKIIIDLVRIDKDKISEGNYVGICW
jgi:GDP-mannose 6-dehydrogenase